MKSYSGNLFVNFALDYRMKKFHIQRFSTLYKRAWDDFVSKAEVHSILFYRDYMEYHKDRFEDYSLMIFQEDKLVAIFPANLRPNGEVHTHQGLSYGGLIFEKHTYFKSRVNIYELVLRYFLINNVKGIYLRSVPLCYVDDNSHAIILDWIGAANIRNDIYSYIPKGAYVGSNKDRKKYLKKAIKNDFKFKESNDYDFFWDRILIPNLKKRHNTQPVHSALEIKNLKNKFPDSIKLFGVFSNTKMRAGVVVFVHRDVAHTQYISADEQRSDGSLDYLIDNVIKKYNETKSFSFGTSSENMGGNINEGLLYWKESFRSLNTVQSFYAIPTANHFKLNNRLV